MDWLAIALILAIVLPLLYTVYNYTTDNDPLGAGSGIFSLSNNTW